jgi:hypothetical protein
MEGQVTCTKCPSGSYNLNIGSGECTLCSRHESSDEHGHVRLEVVNGLTCDNSEAYVESGYWAYVTWRHGKLNNSSMVMELSTSICGRGRCSGGKHTPLSSAVVHVPILMVELMEMAEAVVSSH